MSLLLAAALAQAATPRAARADAPKLTPNKVILVGDSTMAPASGWGGVFCAQHLKSSTACLNLGRGGRSTRSYRQEGSWDIALAEARVAGYKATWVLIQFGHNDQSRVPERWTELTTEFAPNLRRMVAEVRAVGAVPVLITPLTRREFKDGKLQNNLDEWSAEVRKVATELTVPLVDLNARSAALVQKLGAEAATQLAQSPPSDAERAAAKAGTTLKPTLVEGLPPAPEPPATGTGPRGSFTRKFDYTHLGDTGAAVFAKVVAADLARAVPELRSQLVP